MEKFNKLRASLFFLSVMGLFTLLTGCGGGGDGVFGLGEWNKPIKSTVTVSLSSPVNKATGVAVNSKISAVFSAAMTPSSINSSTFTLQQGTTVVPGSVSYSGVTAVFAPTSNLTANTLYTATITTGAADSSGNVLANNYVWSFTTGATQDIIAPTVTGTINANGAINVPSNGKIGVTFSELMDPLTINNQNFIVKETVSGATVAGTVVNSGASAVFTHNNLAYSMNYTVTVKGGPSGVKDLAGNFMVNDFVISWTTGTALDTTAPTVTGTINANNATNVAVNTKVGATFSEGMDPLTVTNQNFTLKETVSGTAVTGTVSYSGVNAVFTPLNNLSSNTKYTATIKGGITGVKDLAGNPMTNDYIWSWTTAATLDTTAPTVTGTINANGAVNVAINTKVGATFSEGMDPLTLTNITFTLKETVSGNPVSGTIGYSGRNAVFTPLSNLSPNTQYTATIKSGITGVKDLAGNSMISDYVWSWTTAAVADTTRPTVTLVNPLDLATNVALNSTVSATFSEAMDPLTISTANFSVAGVTGIVSFDGINKIATFTPGSNLAPSTTYTATVTTGVNDLAGNSMASNKVWSFTTGSGLAPAAVPLASVSTYGTFGGSAGMTNQGTGTIINGDIGTIATTTSSVTGFHDTVDIFTETGSNIGGVNGTIYTCTNSTTGPTSTGVNAPYCARATQARLDAVTAYNYLAAMPSNGVLAGNLAGTTIYPGVYTNSSSVIIQGGNLTLDALGDANALFVFQIGSTLTVGGPGANFPQSIILANGAQAKNIFWQVGTSAIINAGGGGTMAGTIIAQSGVSFSTAGNVTLVTLNGRALSLGASVTMVNTVINVPAP